MTVNFANRSFIEMMYAKYLENPQQVDDSWRHFFEGIDFTEYKVQTPSPGPLVSVDASKDVRIYHLITAYRTYGHLLAKINPIATHPIEEPYELKLSTLGFQPHELAQMFPTRGLLPAKEATLQEILDTLKAIYCDKIGVEYMGLQSPQMESWLQQHIEPSRFRINLSIEQKQMILQHLNRSELFESFLHTKYTGQKRFSIEGGETLIPILEAIIETGAGLGVEDFIIGMAHRGRLNVLSNILKKSYKNIFSEFEEGYIPESFEGSGDVKYHKGFYSEVLTVQGHKVSIVLTPNPSHLEAVDPVVEGQVRAKQILNQDPHSVNKILPILVHGDAAIAGQGVVYETMQLYRLDGYSTGGTIHIVINNQIGFTTLPKDARSTRYCTDIARAFGSPVFHVNAEDPEGCIYATNLAVELRQRFHCDTFIDLNCFRKYGHNEADEPAFTQPLEYQMIRKKRPIREIYRDHLIHQGVLEKKIAESLENEFKESLHDALEIIKIPQKDQKEKPKSENVQEKWSFEPISTAVPLETLQEVTQRFSVIPKDFTVHSKLEHLIKERLAMVKQGQDAKPVDWGMAELLAYASLLWEEFSVRISGQDCCRGTFSHRHGMWVDQVKERTYFPLQHLKENQGRFDLINSPLSEYSVLGFELGYSLADPNTLVIWEAQFGDFCNGAQVVIDQFLAPGEQKWGQRSNLVLLLPHGYEGQGPEHSSARIERFLILTGDDNMQVVYPTTPVQLFHLLRRQMIGNIKKPLIVFTPKGLLRHPACVSQIEEFTRGSFQEILDDSIKIKNCKKLLFCSGRIFYDLIAERNNLKKEDLAFVRIEQLYPLNIEAMKKVLDHYSSCSEYVWVQEEPQNMGAWGFIQPQIEALLPQEKRLKYIGRSRSASPAVGSHALHRKEHAAILKAVFE